MKRRKPESEEEAKRFQDWIKNEGGIMPCRRFLQGFLKSGRREKGYRCNPNCTRYPCCKELAKHNAADEKALHKHFFTMSARKIAQLEGITWSQLENLNWQQVESLFALHSLLLVGIVWGEAGGVSAHCWVLLFVVELAHKMTVRLFFILDLP